MFISNFYLLVIIFPLNSTCQSYWCPHSLSLPEINTVRYVYFINTCIDKALCYQQALVGIAYSFGFIIGPVVGAVFAKRSSLESGNSYLLPALFAITLTVADLMFVYVCLRESLPKEKRVMHFIKFFTFPFQ